VTRPAEGVSLGPVHLLVLIASLLAGVATAFALMPTVFRNAPTDLSRIGVLLDALRDPAERPEVVVFGNSVMMSGIDAAQLGDELPGRPLAWNLASTGQTLVESALLAQELRESARIVIYTTQLRPNADGIPLNPQKGNSYYLYGFRPNDELLQALSRIYGAGVMKPLTRSHLAQLFEARWVVRQLLDTQMRLLLRSDLMLGRAETDLFHPQSYSVPIAPEKLKRFLDIQMSALSKGSAAVSERDRELARTLAKWASRAGRISIFVIPPVHPTLLAAHGSAFAHAVEEFSLALGDSPDTIVIDATAALESSHFIDEHHPNDAGARILTTLVARRIAEGR
jgi:hypothetical protein